MDMIPSYAKAGVTPHEIFSRLRVVDAASGKTIDKVTEADTDAGTLTRFEVKDGNLVVRKDKLSLLTEKRAIRFEWIDADPATMTADAPLVADTATPAVEPTDAGAQVQG